jgi:hypothetical protein
VGVATRNALIARGFDNATASRLDKDGHTLSSLQRSSDETLLALGLQPANIDALREGARPPIPARVLDQVLYESHWVCVICHDPSLPVVVHHIESWESSHSHDEDNLAVLCQLHHDAAHTKRELSQNLTPDRIRDAKARWLTNVKRENAKVARATPPADVLDVEIEAQARVAEGGWVEVQGTTNLPNNTKLWTTLRRVGEPQQHSRGECRVDGGTFHSICTAKEGEQPTPGRYKVEVLAYFNGPWQSKEVRAITGEDGVLLRGPAIRALDDDVEDPHFILKLDAPVAVAGTRETAEAEALAIVQQARLDVPRHGLSSETIAGGVDIYMSTPNLRPRAGWRVTQCRDGTYDVAFNYWNGEGIEADAIWNVLLETRDVQYVNLYAKYMSGIPTD